MRFLSGAIPLVLVLSNAGLAAHAPQQANIARKGAVIEGTVTVCPNRDESKLEVRTSRALNC
jgi:hypothetical protein